MNTNKHEFSGKKEQLDNAGFAAGTIMVIAVFGNLAAFALLLLLGEAFHASKLACEHIDRIRQHCAEAGLLNKPCGSERIDFPGREHGNGFSVANDAPSQSAAVELANAAGGDLKQCTYCDMRKALPVTRGDCFEALYEAFFTPGVFAGTQLVRCGHDPDCDDERRADRGGMHWQAAVAAFNLRRDIEASRKSHKKTESKQENSEENPEFMIREDKF